MKRFSFKNLFFNVTVAMLVSLFVPVPAAAAVGGSIALGALQSFVTLPGGAYMAINKQVWTDVILEGFYPKDDFLLASVDMTELVTFNTINMAEAGADPAVLIDNTSYPISSATRSDTALTVTLKTLDTESTIVRNLEKKESSYNKVESVVRGHRNALRKASIQLAAHNWSASSDGTYTPVLAATGDVYNGYKRLLFEDVLKMHAKLMALDLDIEGMNMLLNPIHLADLMYQDMKLYKTMMETGRLWGIRLFTNSQTPRFNKSTGARVAFGAAAAPSTDTIASTFWHRDEVMKADGELEVFAKYNDPDQKGDVINFQKRFIALPLRSKGLGAIYSPTS